MTGGRVSFRLDPNALEGGDVATLRPEFVPPPLQGQELTVRILEVEEDGSEGEVVAAFTAALAEERDDEGALVFAEATRQRVEADVEGDMELPEAEPETSRDGATTVPGTETTWRRAHFKLRLAGLDEEHVVIVRAAEERDSRRREGGVYELGVAVDGGGGEEVFRSEAQITLLSCWRQLAANCADAARNQLEVHHHLVEERGYGDYYGSQSAETDKAGKRVTDCVSYIIQVLERAYGELRATADYRYLFTEGEVTVNGKTRSYKRYHLGSLFAPALHELGWELVLGVASPELLERRAEDQGDWRWRAVEDALDSDGDEERSLFGTELEPVQVVHGYLPADPDAAPDPSSPANTFLDALRDEVPFGILGLHLGDHIVMKVGPDIYECHWAETSKSARLFDRQRTFDALRERYAGRPSVSTFWMAVPPFALRAAVERTKAELGWE